MPRLFEFAQGLLDGTLLVALAVAVGGIPWALVVLRARQRAADDPMVRQAARLVVGGALALAVCQVLELAIKISVLEDLLGTSALTRFAETVQFRAGALRAVLGAALAGAGLWVVRRPNAGTRWAVAAVLAAMLLVAGAWLVHGAARLEDRESLMALTALHQAAAAVWVGGLVQLAALTRLRRRDPRVDAAWPEVVGRFGRVALASLALLLVAGLPLAVRYVGSWNGLVGTGYGSLLGAKIALTLVVLGFGGFNYLAGRRAARGHPETVRERTPAFVQAETILLVALVFIATALSSQPPAIDTPGDQATLAEVVETFRPKWPTLTTPSLAEKRKHESDPLAVVGGERTATEYSWSNFSHNVAGLFLLPMSLVALAAHGARSRWARHWPLGFVGLAVFVFLRSAASEGSWPFGDVPLFEDDAEGFQHRIGAVLALALGLLEWRARTAERPGPSAYVFPVLAAAGGILLLIHAHAAFEVKSNYLIQVTHVAMGALAVLLACGRWLELRLPPPGARAAGTAASTAMLLIALVLLFYREANIVID